MEKGTVPNSIRKDGKENRTRFQKFQEKRGEITYDRLL